MKFRIVILGLAFAIVLPCAGAQSAPLDRAEVLGRLAVGYPPSYVAKLVKVRGIRFFPTADFLYRVKLAGGDGILVERLSSADAATPLVAPTDESGPVDHLAKCAELIHTGAIEAAEPECRAAIAESPKSPWPLLATADLIRVDPYYPPPSESDIKRQEERVQLRQRAGTLDPGVAAVRNFSGPLQPAPDAHQESATSVAEDFEQGEIGQQQAWPGSLEAMTASIHMAWTNDPIASGSHSPEPVTIDPELLRRVQIEPDLATNHMYLARQYAVAHDFENAQAQWRDVLRLEPENVFAHSAMGMLLLVRHQADASLAELREAVRIVPYGISPRIILAAALETLGQVREATAELQSAVVAHPADTDASNALVEIYLEQKNLDGAIEELRRYLKASSPSFADDAELVDKRFGAEYQLANLLQQDRQLDAAAEQYLYLLRFKPDVPGIHNDYGNVLLDQRDFDAAIGEYNQVLRLTPDDSTAHHNIGLCLLLKKDLDGAISEFRRTLELNPNEARTQIFLGTALGQKGDMKAAKEQFQQATEKNPNNADTHLDIAYALMQLKEEAGAVAQLKVALELQPDSPGAENNLAWVYCTAEDHQLRNPAEALILARRAVETSPSPNPAFLDTLAEAQSLNGQGAEALATETQALKLDPQNTDFQASVARFRDAAVLPTSAKR
jgi:tetratricopeptide (TPR) repeat protein